MIKAYVRVAVRNVMAMGYVERTAQQDSMEAVVFLQQKKMIGVVSLRKQFRIKERK